MSFYNTTNETGPTLAEYRHKAESQEAAVLTFFTQRGGLWTPSEVRREALPHAPLTSARRAISNLTAAGKLVRTTVKRLGDYGRREHAWALPNDPEQPDMFQRAA